MLKTASSKFLVASGLFVVAMMACLILRPEGLTIDFGISYYGTMVSTAIPYSIGLLSCAVLLWSTSGHEGLEFPPAYRWSLRVFAVLLIGVMLTPYNVGWWFDKVHTTVGSIAFVIAILQVGWLAISSNFDRRFSLDWIVMFLAGALCAWWVPQRHGYLIEAQFAFLIAFGHATYTYLRSLELGTVSEAIGNSVAGPGDHFP
jgi:hypothetical protein